MSIMFRFLALGLLLSSSCSNQMDKCMIGEYNGNESTLSNVVAHINRECDLGNCEVRAVVDAGIANRKVVGKLKIGKGTLTMFLQGVKGTFNCDAKLEKNRLIFY